jgi:ABC-type nitrate/sulfonate/bicarbonate transport system substrate-binding protein
VVDAYRGVHREVPGPGQLSRRTVLRLLGSTAGAVMLGACATDQPADTTATTAGAAVDTTATTAGSAGTSATTAAAAAAGPFSSNLEVLDTGYEDPNWGHHVADIVAYEKGFLEEVGFTGSNNLIIGNSLNTVVGGGVQWTSADTDAIVIAGVEHDQDIAWIGCMRDKEGLLFGLAPGVTLESLVADNGFVSGGEIGTRGELLSMKMLEELGVGRDEVQWVTMGGGSDTRIAALLSGDLHGTALRPRHVASLEEVGGTVVYNEQRIIAQEGYTVKRSFLEENRDAVTAYLYAVIKAKQYISDYSTKDEIIEIMTAHEFEFPQEFVDTYEETFNNHSFDGGFEIPEMELIFEEMSEVGEVPADIDWRSVVDLESLWAAQEALGLPRRPASL